MQTKTKTRKQTQAKKAFQWGITSNDVTFVTATELETARDGSTGGDCSLVSSVPRKRETGQAQPRQD